MDAQLKTRGWFLTNEGLDLCKEGLVNPSVDTLIQRALDIDLRLLSSGSHDDPNKGKTDAVQGPLILQIQKIRNVASPKLNEESNYAPKLLRIQLTDGNGTYSGLLLYTIPKIDMNTTPGTKLLIKGRLALKQGLMLLDQNNTKVLGGYVDEMVARWKLAKTLSQFTRATKVEGAPPPWVPFGQRKNIASSHRNDHSGKGGKKSLEGNQKDLTETDKAFEEQRKAAIQEVGKHQSKKFGGGKAVPSNMDRMKESRKSYEEKQEMNKGVAPPIKPNTTQGIYRSLSGDSNISDETEIQNLTSMGFGREASISALKNSNGNVDAAIDYLLAGGGGGDTGGDTGVEEDRGSRFRDNHQGGFRGGGRNYDSRGGGRGSDTRRGGRSSDGRRGGRNFDSRGRGRGGSDNNRRRGDGEHDEEFPSQPSGGTTLFDFLESKLGKDANKDAYSGPSSGYQKAYSGPSSGYQKASSGPSSGYQKASSGPSSGYQKAYNGPSSGYQKASSGPSSGYQKKSERNYAKEQPNSVRDSGIKFVHGAGREQEDSRRGGGSIGGGKYDKGTKDEPAPRSNQSDNPRGSQNDRKTNPKRTDTRPQSDRGANRSRQDKGAAQPNQRNNQYTLPPRFQKLQEVVESKKATPGRQVDDGEEFGEQRQNDASRKSLRDPAAPHMNGKHSQDPRTGSEMFRSQQIPQQISGYERNQPEEGNMIHWTIGDMCVAKYWEDNGFYTATITAIHPSGKTCVVHFLEYGNQEEVLVSDIHPLPNQSWGGMPPPHQFPPPNHMMVPQPYHDARNSYNRAPPQQPQQRFNPDLGSNNFYQGGRR